MSTDSVVIEPTTYRTHKGAQNHVDALTSATPEQDMGWHVLRITAQCFAVARPYQEGDERHGYVPHTPSKRSA